jgi:hypothetical protein
LCLLLLVDFSEKIIFKRSIIHFKINTLLCDFYVTYNNFLDLSPKTLFVIFINFIDEKKHNQYIWLFLNYYFYRCFYDHPMTNKKSFLLFTSPGRAPSHFFKNHMLNIFQFIRVLFYFYFGCYLILFFRIKFISYFGNSTWLIFIFIFSIKNSLCRNALPSMGLVQMSSLLVECLIHQLLMY